MAAPYLANCAIDCRMLPSFMIGDKRISWWQSKSKIRRSRVPTGTQHVSQGVRAMIGGLPPLQWLVTFRAVMEAGNFARAAEHLSLTPSAVSHQMRALESQIVLRATSLNWNRGSQEVDAT
jgi:Bacterial regulatory helix-turn-helix protein, lysR family